MAAVGLAACAIVAGVAFQEVFRAFYGGVELSERTTQESNKILISTWNSYTASLGAAATDYPWFIDGDFSALVSDGAGIC